MNKKSAMGQRIQELRKDAGLTQEQLAQRIGVSMAAVRNYENGLREPNSKAMAALERFFKVSGEYLRGDIDRETFLQNSATIQDRLDGLVGLFQTFKLDFDCSSQERQMLAVSILSGVMETVTTRRSGWGSVRTDLPGRLCIESPRAHRAGEAGRRADTAGAIQAVIPFVYRTSLPPGCALVFHLSENHKFCYVHGVAASS